MNSPQIIADRIREVAKSKNIVVKNMLSEINLGANTLQHMKTSFPKTDTIYKIAKYLDVSVDYLLGMTNIPQVKSSDDAEILHMIQQLSLIDKSEIIVLLKNKLNL